MDTLKLFLILLLLVSGGMEPAQACKEGEEFWADTEHRSIGIFSIALQGDDLFVYTDKSFDYVAIQIQDAYGQLYYTAEISMTSESVFVISTQQFPAGIYKISFYTGEELVTKCFTI